MNHENAIGPDFAPLNPETTYGLSSDTFGVLGKAALKEATKVGQDVDQSSPLKLFYNLEKVRRETMRRADSFVRNNGDIVRIFAKDRYIELRASESVETFCFDGRNHRILVPACWFRPDVGYSDDELHFAIYHEVGHFMDLREAVRHEDEYSKNKPQKTNAYLDNFNIMEEKAESLAQSYLGTHPGTSIEEVKEFYYNKLHNLYNVLDDIYVNKLVQSKVPFFKDNGGGLKAIESLYTKLGFNKPDMSEDPLHSQLINSLLSEAMLGTTLGEVKVDPLVGSVLSKAVYGKTLKESIKERIVPDRWGELIDPNLRYYFIRKHIEPEYLRLLELDIEADRDTPENPAPERAENESSDGPGRLSDSNSQNDSEATERTNTPDSIPPVFSVNRDYKEEDEGVREVIDSIREGIDWEGKTVAEREIIQKQEATESFDDKHGITKKERKAHDEAVSQITGLLSEMGRFWDRLIGNSVNYTYEVRDRQKSGDLNRDNLIENFVSLQKGDIDGLRVYERGVHVRETTKLAEKIEVTLLVDCSGSMYGTKTEVARQTAALLMYSIRSFNQKLDKARKQTHSKLYADTEVIAFGDKFNEVKPFSGKNVSKTDDIAIIKSISAIDANRGSTDDAAPLGYILNKLTTIDISKMKQQKLKKIIFEITDGASQTPGPTAETLNRLASEGAIVVGFQVGDVSENDKKIFEATWDNANLRSENASRKKGIRIEDISDLPRRLMEALSDQLGDISNR